MAGAGVEIQLAVPAHLFAHAKPLDDAPVFVRRQRGDGGDNFLDSAHEGSLSP